MTTKKPIFEEEMMFDDIDMQAMNGYWAIKFVLPKQQPVYICMDLKRLVAFVWKLVEGAGERMKGMFLAIRFVPFTQLKISATPDPIVDQEQSLSKQIEEMANSQGGFFGKKYHALTLGGELRKARGGIVMQETYIDIMKYFRDIIFYSVQRMSDEHIKGATIFHNIGGEISFSTDDKVLVRAIFDATYDWKKNDEANERKWESRIFYHGRLPYEPFTRRVASNFIVHFPIMSRDIKNLQRTFDCVIQKNPKTHQVTRTNFTYI